MSESKIGWRRLDWEMEKRREELYEVMTDLKEMI
jgi:hypothetical protein